MLKLWSVADVALVVDQYDTLNEMKRLNCASRRSLSFTNPMTPYVRIGNLQTSRTEVAYPWPALRQANRAKIV